LRDELEALNDELMTNVISAVDHNGKRLYTNAETREIALRELQRSSVAHRKLRATIRHDEELRASSQL
jgi:hypothetical protein